MHIRKGFPLLIALFFLFCLPSFGKTCVVYLSWPSLGRDLVEKEVEVNALIAEAEAEKTGLPFYRLSGLREVEVLGKGCSNLYLFLAGHSDEELIGPYSPEEIRETLSKVREKGTRIPLLVFDTCYWGEVYRLRYFSFPETVVVGSVGEELHYGLKGLYRNLAELVRLRGKDLSEKVLSLFGNYYYPLYSSRGKELKEAGFRCQTVRTYYRGVVLSQSVCFDR